MKKYQIAEIAGEQAHAGTKATEDVIRIAQKVGFQPLYVRMNDMKDGAVHKMNRQIQFAKDWSDAYRNITPESIVLLQHPFHYPQLTRERNLLKLKNEKKCRFISVVHDVEELRNLGKEEYHKHEFNFMLEIADVLVVHNNVMRDFFISKGVDKHKLIVLGIFDYLRDDYSCKLPQFEKSITIAGNLDVKKSAYLSQLGKVDCRFQLYGPNFSLYKTENVDYGGVLPPARIPDVLTSGFGLIWDGESIETCKGGFGGYLRYNNPHKLSLYLSAGLPVIIWKEAAEAKFVEENRVGLTVSSLYDIPTLLAETTEEKYRDIVQNVSKIAKKLVGGEYMNRSLVSAIELIDHENNN